MIAYMQSMFDKIYMKKVMVGMTACFIRRGTAQGRSVVSGGAHESVMGSHCMQGAISMVLILWH